MTLEKILLSMIKEAGNPQITANYRGRGKVDVIAVTEEKKTEQNNVYLVQLASDANCDYWRVYLPVVPSWYGNVEFLRGIADTPAPMEE